LEKSELSIFSGLTYLKIITKKESENTDKKVIIFSDKSFKSLVHKKTAIKATETYIKDVNIKAKLSITKNKKLVLKKNVITAAELTEKVKYKAEP
jgi:hypothetical protein